MQIVHSLIAYLDLQSEINTSIAATVQDLILIWNFYLQMETLEKMLVFLELI